MQHPPQTSAVTIDLTEITKTFSSSQVAHIILNALYNTHNSYLRFLYPVEVPYSVICEWFLGRLHSPASFIPHSLFITVSLSLAPAPHLSHLSAFHKRDEGSFSVSEKQGLRSPEARDWSNLVLVWVCVWVRWETWRTNCCLTKYDPIARVWRLLWCGPGW